MSKHVALFFAAGIVATLAPSAASACLPPLPVSADVAAEREQARQADLWTRSDAVFLAELSDIEALPAASPREQGNRAELAPSFALKGETPATRIDIRHTPLTSCGYIPFLDALSGDRGDWFVVFARALPSGLSVDATVPVNALIDAEALRAWRKSHDTTEPGGGSEG